MRDHQAQSAPPASAAKRVKRIHPSAGVRPLVPSAIPADADPRGTAAVHVPVTLFPSPFPRECFEQGLRARAAYNELYAAGRYTLQSRKEKGGVADAVGRKDKTVQEDVVVWSVFGLTHNPRVEDWPVM